MAKMKIEKIEGVSKKKQKKAIQPVSVQPSTIDPMSVGSIQVSHFNYDQKLYLKLYLFLFGNVMKDYHFRKRWIRFIFEDGRWVRMKVRSAIVNLIFWKPYCDFNRMITAEHVFNTDDINEDTIADKMDLIIDDFRNTVPIEDLCKSLRHVIESLAQIPLKFCLKVGNTLSLRDIIDLADRNPEFDEILHTNFQEGTPIGEIEREIAARNQKAVNIIKSDVMSNFRVFLMAGGNINLGQLAQCIVSIGPRSDINGNISPVIINTNFILGLKSVSDYFLESFSCRKALIANKYQMSDSGYTGRQIDLLVCDANLVPVDDCHSPHYVLFKIPDEKTLRMMDYKYIETGIDKKGNPVLHQINSKIDKHLIGQTVKMRSVITCALEQGSYCKTCYGGLSYVTMGFHVGLLASHSFSEPVSQTVLSTKHLIKTKAKNIAWSETMFEFFRCETNNAYILPEYCNADVSIGFYTEDVEDYLDIFTAASEDDDDDENQDVLFDYVNRFVLKIGDRIVPFDNIETELYINQDFLDKLLKATVETNGILYVSLSGFDPTQPIFDANIENTEILVYLKRIMKLLGIKSKTSYTTIEDLLQTLTAAMVDIGININISNLECIIYNMIRDPNIVIYRPDFKHEAYPNYTILPTSNAITYSASLSTSLSFERLAAQFRTPITYMKNKPSFLDPYFR